MPDAKLKYGQSATLPVEVISVGQEHSEAGMETRRPVYEVALPDSFNDVRLGKNPGGKVSLILLQSEVDEWIESQATPPV